MARDILFQEESATRDFTFDTKVAQVFDDMVGRSVPFYAELQHMLADLTLQFTPSQDGASAISAAPRGRPSTSSCRTPRARRRHMPSAWTTRPPCSMRRA
ncbi:MAG: hypothetical protein WDO68_16160 [Gammaproteobacteria bacterium]